MRISDGSSDLCSSDLMAYLVTGGLHATLPRMVCIQENGSANRGVICEEARHLRRGGEAALIEPDAKPNFNQREDVSDWGKAETEKFPKLVGVLLGLGIHEIGRAHV